MDKLIGYDNRHIFVNQELLKEMCERDGISFENLLTTYTSDDVEKIAKDLNLDFYYGERKIVDSIAIIQEKMHEIELKAMELNLTNSGSDTCDLLFYDKEEDFIQALCDRGFDYQGSFIKPDYRGKLREVYPFRCLDNDYFVLIDNY